MVGRVNCFPPLSSLRNLDSEWKYEICTSAWSHSHWSAPVECRTADLPFVVGPAGLCSFSFSASQLAHSKS